MSVSAAGTNLAVTKFLSQKMCLKIFWIYEHCGRCFNVMFTAARRGIELRRFVVLLGSFALALTLLEYKITLQNCYEF